jgi:deoxycytidylate deaminase
MNMTKAWKRGFDAAKAASLYSNAKHSRRVGASLFSNSTLLAVGFNTYAFTHPRSKWNMHAEMRAIIRRQYYNDRKSVLYVYREKADGTPACSKPCAFCSIMIREAGIKTVRFINDKGLPEEIKI